MFGKEEIVALTLHEHDVKMLRTLQAILCSSCKILQSPPCCEN